jgi:hypothetical protein
MEALMKAIEKRLDVARDDDGEIIQEPKIVINLQKMDEKRYKLITPKIEK